MLFKNQGFSLIELLIVIAIIAVTASFAVPDHKSFLASAQQQTQRAQLIHAINYARSEARLREVPVSLCGTQDFMRCSNTWQNGVMVFADENADGVPVDKNHIIYVFHHAIKNGTWHWQASLNSNYLLFDPASLMAHADGKFWLCASPDVHAQWAIVVSLAGRPREVTEEKELQKLGCATSSVS